jgi:uncharacterized protein (TIGR02246 family)
MSNSQTIDSLVAAYNAHDARAFADHFSVDASHGNLNSDIRQQGREEIYRRYVEVFAQFPQNHTQVLHRTVLGQYVLDHERVRRSPDADPFEVVAIYTFDAELIQRLDFVR